MYFVVDLDVINLIQTNVLKKMDSTERIIVSYIYSYDKNKGYFGTIETLADVCGVTTRSIKNKLKKLKELEILIVPLEPKKKARYFLNPECLVQGKGIKNKESFPKSKEKYAKNKENYVVKGEF